MVIYQEMFSIILVIKMQFTQLKKLMKKEQKNKKKIIEEVINSDYIISLTKHEYGNYAVQHFLEYSDEKIRNSIIEKIKSVKNIESDKSAKYVFKKIEELNNKKWHK